MKSELRVVPHHVLPGANTVEVWYGGRFICAIYGADGPGINILSRFQMAAKDVDVKQVTDLPGLHAICVSQLKPISEN